MVLFRAKFVQLSQKRIMIKEQEAIVRMQKERQAIQQLREQIKQEKLGTFYFLKTKSMFYLLQLLQQKRD